MRKEIKILALIGVIVVVAAIIGASLLSKICAE